MRKILFLGYSKKETQLIDFLNSKKNLLVTHHKNNKKISAELLNNFDATISYGYRFIIQKEVIENIKKPIINLHISYLPFNRGAHPNFWSFAENTPSGITIHELNNKIDSGKIVFQKQIDFELLKNRNKLTFNKTYKKLILEVENLFKVNYKNLLSYDYDSSEQVGKGSFHKLSDLPSIVKDWNQNIFETVKRYNGEKSKFVRRNALISEQIPNSSKSKYDLRRIKIRNATNQDINDTYNWRNDPISRKFSIHTELIDKENHNKWFKKNILNEDNSYFICSIDKKKIGFIRYEKNNEHSLAVSINLDPKYRNMGLGTEMLLKTQRKKKIKDKNCILYARIKKNNIGSIKAFEKAGYSKVKELNNYYLFCNNGNHANV